ncbi:fibronectin type III domain protein [Opisthorchis viverrini]|uniref:Fibronectin type III domain protein n=1 Tax=Opisthorchis viverrini TaxID=6198 RepID=A0A1S8X9W5_OPIVI|nr:fibronectin type III domain protein [Opisthorchis viverrini]
MAGHVKLELIHFPPEYKPESPTDIRAKPLDMHTVQLEYTLPKTSDAAPITEILLEYRPKGQSRWFSLTVPVANTATISKLEPGTEYEFRVSCSNVAGAGQPSRVVKAQTMEAPNVDSCS